MNATAIDHVAVEYLKPVRKWLDQPGVTDLWINRPEEVFVQGYNGRERHDDPELNYTRLEAMMNSIANHTQQEVGRRKPKLSATLPGGERVEIMRDPGVPKGMITIAARKPSAKLISLEEMREQGMFDEVEWVKSDALSEETRQYYEDKRLTATDKEIVALCRAGTPDAWKQMLSQTMGQKKNLLVCGETGSGKTTIMKSLVSQIDKGERLLSIENVGELDLYGMGFANSVPMFYSANASQDNGELTQSELMQASLRMDPDRVFVSELIRGDEAYEYLQSINSGHPGTLSTTHALSARHVWGRMVDLLLNSKAYGAQNADVLRNKVVSLVEAVIFVEKQKQPDGGAKRCVSQVYFDPAATMAALDK